MHYIVQGDVAAFCDWLDVEIEGTPDCLSPVFAAEKVTADLLVRVGPERLMHVEYIRRPEADMFARMVGYRAHIMRLYRGMSLVQFAVVLGSGRLQSGDDPEHGFSLGLRTIYLPDVDPDEFLTRPGLAGLAGLTKGDQETRAKSVIVALEQIRTFSEERQRGIRGAMATLAPLSLVPSTIDLIMKESGMSIESVAEFYSQTEVGQEIHKQGLEQGSTRILAAVLRGRFGDAPEIPLIARRLARASSDDASIRVITSAESLGDLLEPPSNGELPHN